MRKLNLYTILWLGLFLILCVLAFFWGGEFLLLPMAARLSIGICSFLALVFLGMKSRRGG